MKTTAKLFLTLLLLVPLCAHASDGDKDKLPLLTVTKAAGQQAPFVAQGNQRSASVSQVRASRAQGVTTQLTYERIADMKTARISHQIFPSGNGFVVVGGRTTGFKLTPTAELYQDGKWTDLSISSPHDGAFSALLENGRVMVGGGFSRGGGEGQTTAVDIYDPSTHSFTQGAQLSVKRAMSKALVAGSTVYVSGNWYADDNVMDFYSGSTFSPLGNMDGRSSPYLFVDVDGNIISLSAYGTKGESFGFHTYDDGSQALLADKYIPSSGKTQYLGFPFTPQSFPMMLTDDVRPSDYHFKYNGENYFLLLLKQGSKYELQMFNSDTYTMYGTPELDIPVKHPVTNETITWRGGVIVNETRQEVYLIGTSGSVSDQTLHIISYNYVTAEWTIASAPGFNHNMLTASWTLLADGRLACTGGGIHDNTDAQRSAYLITPPVAGHSGGDNPPSGSEPRLVVWMKAGDRVTYDLADNPVTTFSGSQLVIRTNNLIITYERKDVLRYTYENVTYNGIDMMPGERRVQVNREGDEVTFRGLTIGSTAYIYSVNGTLLEQHEVTDSQPLTVSLHNRPNGVYIVKAGTETIKVLKK